MKIDEVIVAYAAGLQELERNEASGPATAAALTLVLTRLGYDFAQAGIAAVMGAEGTEFSDNFHRARTAAEKLRLLHSFVVAAEKTIAQELGSIPGPLREMLDDTEAGQIMKQLDKDNN